MGTRTLGVHRYTRPCPLTPGTGCFFPLSVSSRSLGRWGIGVNFYGFSEEVWCALGGWDSMINGCFLFLSKDGTLANRLKSPVIMDPFSWLIVYTFCVGGLPIPQLVIGLDSSGFLNPWTVRHFRHFPLFTFCRENTKHWRTASLKGSNNMKTAEVFILWVCLVFLVPGLKLLHCHDGDVVVRSWSFWTSL